MTIATTSDVTDRLGRPLTESEVGQVTLWLGDVERDILRRQPAALQMAGADPNYFDTMSQIEANAVIRKINNPQGLQSETLDSYSYNRGTSSNTGTTSLGLDLSNDEWRALGVITAVGWVQPPGYRRPYPTLAEWNGLIP
jgi:hypothetical protein